MNGIRAVDRSSSVLRDFKTTDTLRQMSLEDRLAELKILYPNLSAEELVIAKENLDRYILLAWEIFEDLEMERRANDPDFSVSDSQGKIQAKVDSPQT